MRGRLITFSIIMILAALISLFVVPESRAKIFNKINHKPIKDTMIVLPIEIKDANGGEELYIDDVKYDKDSSKTITVKFK